MAQKNDLMTIGNSCGPDQAQQPEQKTGDKPRPAVASLLPRNRRGQEGAGQMGSGNQQQQHPVHGQRDRSLQLASHNHSTWLKLLSTTARTS